MRIWMTIAALLLSATSLFAQQKERVEKSEVVVYYRHDKYYLDHRYMTNPEAFATLDSLMQHHAEGIDSISIVAYASPEGRLVYNQWLSEKRAESMKRFLKVKYPAVDFSNLKTFAKGEDFEGLVEMVEADKSVPYRKEVLKILKNTKLHVDARMKLLYKLRSGTPYRYIRKNILPWLRTATTCIIYYQPDYFAERETFERLLEEPLIVEQVGGGSLICGAPKLADCRPLPYQLPREAEEQIVTTPVETPATPEEQPAVSEQQQPAQTFVPIAPTERWRDHLVALKTNLLFDALAAVNVGLEIPVGNRFSIEGTWIFPWYLQREWNWCYQLLWGDVEGRLWLGERTRNNRLKGHFVGLYAGGGLYDFQWKSTDGYQGEFFIAAGVGYGYSMALRNGWNLEFELGIGYLQSDYRHYFHITDADGREVLIRDNVSGRFGYWGPTKAKVSLVVPIEWSVNSNRTRRVTRD